MIYITNRNIILWTFTIVISFQLLSCRTSQDFINFNEINQGIHLDKAKEIIIDTFLTIWIENESKPKFDMNLNELYKDSTFTYFGKQRPKYQSFYKIKNENLNSIDYKSIIGDSIRMKFYYEIIPLKDRNKRNNCSSAFIDFDYKYRYIESETSIEIKCQYKVVCEFLIRIIKEEYIAKYDIKSRTLKKLD